MLPAFPTPFRVICRRLAAAAPWLLAAIGVALNAGIGRPIWYDEFVHFSLAAEPTTADALRTLAGSLGSLNHGQTGVYMMVNAWTLGLTGASALAMRLPSILSAAFMLGSAILLFRMLGFSVLWQLAVTAALIGQHALLYFAGEARPYMPLAGAAVGLLAYHVGRVHHPGSSALLALGCASALLGVLMHPYIALYWPVALLVGLLHLRAVSHRAITPREALAFANPVLVGAGALLFLALAACTWLRPSPAFGFDPWFWMRRAGIWANALDYGHTQFLAGRYGWAAAFGAIPLLGLSLLPAWARRDRARLGPPAALILLAAVASGVVAWLSVRAGYWVLGRQWVASYAFVAIGVVWFWAELGGLWRRAWRLCDPIMAVAALLLVSGQVSNIAGVRMREIEAGLRQQRDRQMALDCTPPALPDLAGLSRQARDDLLVSLAVRNIDCGGAPWPIFRAFHPMTLAIFPDLLEELARLSPP